MRIVQLENEITARIEDVNKYFISKDKMKEKIEELEKEKAYFKEQDFIAETVKRINQIEVLQELLEDNENHIPRID